MKRIVRYTGILVTGIIIVFLVLYSTGNIGVSKSNIEKAARSASIDESWQVAKATTDHMSAMIFYDESLTDYRFSIYANRPGMSFGYFFIKGGAANWEMEGVAEYRFRGSNESIYISMNKQHVDKIEINNGNNIEVIDIDSKKPFAIILPIGKGIIRIYDENGYIVPTISQF